MKWMTWLAKTCVKVTVICFLCTFVTFSLAQMYMTQLFGSVLPQFSAGQPIGFVDFLSHVASPSNINREHSNHTSPVASNERVADIRKDAALESETSGMDEVQADQNAGEDAWHAELDNGHAAAGNSETEEESQENAFEGAIPVWGSQSLSISAEDIIRVKEQLSDEEKMEIFTIIAAKIPFEEIQTLSALLENGLSASEIEQADQLIRQYLDEEDYAYFLDIFFNR